MSIEKLNLQKLQERADYDRIPSVNEMYEIQKFGIRYKKRFPKASKREIRIATQKQFNCRMVSVGNKWIQENAKQF